MTKYDMLLEIDPIRLKGYFNGYPRRFRDANELSRIIGQEPNYISSCINHGFIGVTAAIALREKANIHPERYIKDYGKMVPYNKEAVRELLKKVDIDRGGVSTEISHNPGLLTMCERTGKINIVFAKFLEGLYGIKCYTEEAEQEKEPEAEKGSVEITVCEKEEQQKEEQQKAAVKEEPKESTEPAIDYDKLAMAIALAFDFALERYRNGSRGAYNPLFKRFIEEAGKNANAEKGDHE